MTNKDCLGLGFLLDRIHRDDNKLLHSKFTFVLGIKKLIELKFLCKSLKWPAAAAEFHNGKQYSECGNKNQVKRIHNNRINAIDIAALWRVMTLSNCIGGRTQMVLRCVSLDSQVVPKSFNAPKSAITVP